MAALDPTNQGQRKGIVLFGIGGSGKTQLVLQYVEKYRQSYTTILWINASSVEHTKQSFAQAAGLISSGWPPDTPVPLAGSEDWQKVTARLRCTVHRRWLLVIDSIDDLDQDDFKRYIPSCNFGSIIITSTYSQAPYVFRLSSVEVGSLGLRSASELLFARASTSNGDAVSRECKNHKDHSRGTPFGTFLTRAAV